MQYQIRYWLLLIGGLFAIQACRQDAQVPIERFQKSTSSAVAAIGTFYNDLNAYERRLYFQSVALNPAQRLEAIDAQGQPTPFLSDPFSTTAIQARLALLRQLGTYAERLTALASNDAPERFRTNTASLANTITTLQETFTSLSTTEGNGDAGRYIGPLGTLAGVVGNMMLTNRREVAVRKAILDGEQSVNRLLVFLERDLEKYVSTTRLAGAEQQLSDISLLYNSEKQRLTYEQRQKRLEEVAKLVEEYKVLQTVRPSDVVRQMKTAHQTLVQAVRNDNPLTVDLLLGAIDDYEASVRSLLDALQDLHELTRSKNENR